MAENKQRALIIGAGPSGLVTCKYLLESNHDVTILEQHHEIGGTFVNKVYDGTRLVSSKYITAFSDFRMVNESGVDTDKGSDSFPINSTNHPSAEDYVLYLKAYARRFKIESCIKFNCKVISLKAKEVEGSDDGGDFDLDSNGYVVQYENSDGKVIEEQYDTVAVCSGLHNVPNIPEQMKTESMKETFQGSILHSSQYKDSSVFDNKRVLILGSGETAMDIALRAIRNPKSKSVAMNVRRGFLSIPHNLAADRPLDVFITNLFEHAYEHPWVHALRLRWWLSTVVIRFFLFLTGSSVGFNQWACETTPIKRGYHIINKSHAAMSHLNVPIKSKSMMGRFWMKVYGEEGLDPIESFHRTSISKIGDDGKTIYFDDGRSYEADIIVLATGYKQYFPFLDDAIRKEHRREAMANSVADSSPMFKLEEDYLPSEHFITSKRMPRLGFIGFVRPNVGAIPPMSELQVMWWICKMRGQVKMLPHEQGIPRTYMVLGAKYPYGVDYGNYMHRIAEDFGAAPTLSILARSSHPLRALFTYCMGQSHVPLFRLCGPFQSETCWNVTNEELWNVCLQRGLGENLGLVSVCLISLWMNLAACILEVILCFATLRRPKFFARY